MAHYAELDTDDPEIGLLGYDINYTQTAQIGQMQGWLALWDLPQVVHEPHMAWMTDRPRRRRAMTWMDGHHRSGRRPAAAPPPRRRRRGRAHARDGHPAEEMNRLKSLHGKESDIYFLQLMIRHHQGGAPMMEDAQIHAENPVVGTSPPRCWSPRPAR